jgi:hypothetical protein
MISRIKRWIYSKFFIFDEEIASVSKIKTEASCTRDTETRKRVAKAFEEQAEAMKCRAMKAHDPSCEDPISCKKTFCYQWAPDKIVKIEIVKRRRGRPKGDKSN